MQRLVCAFPGGARVSGNARRAATAWLRGLREVRSLFQLDRMEAGISSVAHSVAARTVLDTNETLPGAQPLLQPLLGFRTVRLDPFPASGPASSARGALAEHRPRRVRVRDLRPLSYVFTSAGRETVHSINYMYARYEFPK